VAQRWPKSEEWAALGIEYTNAVPIMGAQRPGLNGAEDSEQMLSYAKHFANVGSWKRCCAGNATGGTWPTRCYAAWVAGVRIDLARR
jgi:hypothetical protein